MSSVKLFNNSVANVLNMNIGQYVTRDFEKIVTSDWSMRTVKSVRRVLSMNIFVSYQIL